MYGQASAACTVATQALFPVTVVSLGLFNAP